MSRTRGDNLEDPSPPTPRPAGHRPGGVTVYPSSVVHEQINAWRGALRRHTRDVATGLCRCGRPVEDCYYRQEARAMLRHFRLDPDQVEREASPRP